MVAVYTIRTALGIAGNVIAFALFLSPLPTFITIVRRKSTEEFSGVPYIATLFNCLLWVLYGLPFVTPNSVLVITINVIGTALELTYITIFITYGTPKNRSKMIKMFALVLVCYSAIALLVLTVTHVPKTRSFVVGILCVAVCLLMYGAPLSVMKSVIKTKSVQYMPFSISMASFLNAIAWTTYGLLWKIDPFIVIPNGLGIVLSTIQLGLYLVFYRKSKSIAEQQQQQQKGGDLEAGNISKVAAATNEVRS